MCYVVVADVEQLQSGTCFQLHWYGTAEFSHPELQLKSLRMFLALAQSPRGRGYTSCVLQKQGDGVTQQIDLFLSYSSKTSLKFSCSFCPLGSQHWVPTCPLCCSSAPKTFSKTLVQYEIWSLGKVLSCFHPQPPTAGLVNLVSSEISPQLTGHCWSCTLCWLLVCAVSTRLLPNAWKKIKSQDKSTLFQTAY